MQTLRADTLEDYTAGVLARADRNASLQSIAMKLAEAEAMPGAVQSRQTFTATSGVEFADLWDSLSIEQKRAGLRTFLCSIEISHRVGAGSRSGFSPERVEIIPKEFEYWGR
ncbi:MAG: hypothetical protein ACRENX_06165 [Candidatus Dormibacteria bacterium]